MPTKSSKRVAGLSLLLALATGCENPFGGDYLCTADVRPAIEVEIRDAVTGAPIAEGARGAVHDGAYVDSLRAAGGEGSNPFILHSRSAADERPGIYRVEIKHAGYREWTISGIRAAEGRCHVRTQRISASLEPL